MVNNSVTIDRLILQRHRLCTDFPSTFPAGIVCTHREQELGFMVNFVNGCNNQMGTAQPHAVRGEAVGPEREATKPGWKVEHRLPNRLRQNRREAIPPVRERCDVDLTDLRYP